MSTRRERAERIPRCRNCGEVRAHHYVPPSAGDPGFYLCNPKGLQDALADYVKGAFR